MLTKKKKKKKKEAGDILPKVLQTQTMQII